MSEMGLVRAKTLWQKHRRFAILGDGAENDVFAEFGDFSSGSVPD
jgi:hypothetical protein